MVTDRRVWWEVVMGWTDAALGRLGRALFEVRGEVRDWYWIGAKGCGDIVCLVRFEPEKHAAFCKALGGRSRVQYWSPTRFDRGTISSIYATPEDELAERGKPPTDR